MKTSNINIQHRYKMVCNLRNDMDWKVGSTIRDEICGDKIRQIVKLEIK